MQTGMNWEWFTRSSPPPPRPAAPPPAGARPRGRDRLPPRRARRRAGIAAAAEARRRFGNPTLVKETTRDMWTIRWIEVLRPGPALRRAHAAQEPRLHHRRRAHAGARHRRQHRHLQRGRCRHSSPAALSRTGAPGGTLGQREARQNRAPRRILSRLPRLARAEPLLRIHGGIRHRNHDTHRCR